MNVLPPAVLRFFTHLLFFLLLPFDFLVYLSPRRCDPSPFPIQRWHIRSGSLAWITLTLYIACQSMIRIVQMTAIYDFVNLSISYDRRIMELSTSIISSFFPFPPLNDVLWWCWIFGDSIDWWTSEPKPNKNKKQTLVKTYKSYVHNLRNACQLNIINWHKHIRRNHALIHITGRASQIQIIAWAETWTKSIVIKCHASLAAIIK